MFGLGPSEMFFIVLLGVLLFGKRLPEVGRSLGKTIMEFKSSLRGVENEFRDSMNGYDAPPVAPPAPLPRPPQKIAPTAPKFEEPSV